MSRYPMRRLGDYIRLVDERNSELKPLPLMGVSINKVFIPSVANTVGTDMSTYKIVYTGQFAYSAVTSRNGEKISIAHHRGQKPYLVSQAYIVFEVSREEELNPDYLMFWFSRPEFDKLARYMSHGSARETFSWEDFCNLRIPLPPRTVVARQRVISNQLDINNRLIQKLEQTVETLLFQISTNAERGRLGDYIRLVDEQNSELKPLPVLGVGANKAFMPTKANLLGTDLSKYKLIEKGQFACSLMQVSRDRCIPIAMFGSDKAIISPAYIVFEVSHEEELNPDYLMLWFSRPEFDRESSFCAVGGVRGNLEWEDFCNLRIPLPPIEAQRQISSLRTALLLRRDMDTKLREFNYLFPSFVFHPTSFSCQS